VILVDSNVLLDVFTRDPQWYSWSLQALSDAASTNRLVINPIIYSEVSIGFNSVQKLDLVLNEIGLLNEPLSTEVSFLAGKAFLRYRQKGGNKTSPLPDFFIGAHASHENYKLLTRDRHRFLNYFPKLQIIRPNT
jgi:predicted nucleic acid-binding protein